jgi:predicted O-methyltransferase YrrM
MAPPTGPLAISASPRVHALLARLHAASEAQEKTLSQSWFYLKRLIAFYLFSTPWASSADEHMRDKFVALEEDKCHFMYLLARSSGALNIVEAGTSFGVSTIYLALAVGQNVADQKALGKSVSGKVIATEKEPTKAARAREHWAEAGDEVAGVIELREGDLLETLKRDDMPEQVDFLLLDSMSTQVPV